MQWQDFLVALSLVMVLEGLLPFLMPNAWKRLMAQLALEHANRIRTMGLLSMLAGLALLYWVR